MISEVHQNIGNKNNGELNGGEFSSGPYGTFFDCPQMVKKQQTMNNFQVLIDFNQLHFSAEIKFGTCNMSRQAWCDDTVSHVLNVIT